MDTNAGPDDPDVAAIKRLLAQELSLSWGPGKNAGWEGFAGSFLPDAALFPAARPAKVQALDQFIARMKRLRDQGSLSALEVTPLGCEVLVFGNVAVAFAACRLLENQSVTNHEMNATVLVREGGAWRIAAQAWDVESEALKIPAFLRQPKPA